MVVILRAGSTSAGSRREASFRQKSSSYRGKPDDHTKHNRPGEVGQRDVFACTILIAGLGVEVPKELESVRSGLRGGRNLEALTGFIEVKEVVKAVRTLGNEHCGLRYRGDQCPLMCPLGMRKEGGLCC